MNPVEAPRPAESEEPAGPPPAVTPRQSTPFLVLQFFIFPMAIVAVCVAVFLVFGLISGEQKTPRDYLREVRSGGGMFNVKRWQAAFALAGAVESDRDLLRRDPRFLDDVVQLFEEAQGGGDDPLVRRYLVLTLGRMGDRRAVPTLLRVLQDPALGADPQTLVYAVLALGTLADPSAQADLLHLTGSEDAGLRKAAVHALGSFPTPEAQTALVAALDDPVEDVRWNAALSLARRQDPAATPILLKMMDRTYLGTVAGLTPEQQDAAVLESVKAAAVVPNASLRSALERVRAADPDLKAREAAGQALAGKQP